MDREYMYGDAKATAKAVDAGRKQRLLGEAQAAFDAAPGVETGLELSKTMFESGRFIDAERVLGKMLTENKDNLNVLWNLGFVYKNLDKRDSALSAFKQVVKLDPKHQLARSAEMQMWEMDPSFKPSWMSK